MNVNDVNVVYYTRCSYVIVTFPVIRNYNIDAILSLIDLLDASP